MGHALIAMTVPEECLGFDALRVRDAQGNVVPLAEGYLPPADREQLIRDHREAFWVLQIPISAVWQSPREPPSSSRWYRDPDQLAAHREVVRRSLEAFVNGALEGLDDMLRTGWFIIRRARATITELVEVPSQGPLRVAPGRVARRGHVRCQLLEFWSNFAACSAICFTRVATWLSRAPRYARL